MGWKKLPFWLKTGIIFSLLSLITSIIFLSSVVICVDPAQGADLSNPIFGCKSELERLFIQPRLEVFMVPIFFIIISFLAGACVGLVIEKIKSKK